MLYARLLAIAVLPLALVYYTLTALQSFGLVKYTDKDITFPKALIPFYYFFF